MASGEACLAADRRRRDAGAVSSAAKPSRLWLASQNGLFARMPATAEDDRAPRAARTPARRRSTIGHRPGDLVGPVRPNLDHDLVHGAATVVAHYTRRRMRICLVTPFSWSQPHEANDHVAGVAAALRAARTRGHGARPFQPGRASCKRAAARSRAAS